MRGLPKYFLVIRRKPSRRVRIHSQTSALIQPRTSLPKLTPYCTTWIPYLHKQSILKISTIESVSLRHVIMAVLAALVVLSRALWHLILFRGWDNAFWTLASDAFRIFLSRWSESVLFSMSSRTNESNDLPVLHFSCLSGICFFLRHTDAWGAMWHAAARVFRTTMPGNRSVAAPRWAERCLWGGGGWLVGE